MKTVIYHSADYDGIFCREIAWKFLGPKAGQESDCRLLGWNFGDPPIPVPAEGQIYVLDLPVDRVFGLDLKVTDWNEAIPNYLCWIDHHKTSIDSHPTDIPGYRIDGVAACRLAWRWFQEHAIAQRTGEAPRLPEKEHYLNRTVAEPAAVPPQRPLDPHERQSEQKKGGEVRYHERAAAV